MVCVAGRASGLYNFACPQTHPPFERRIVYLRETKREMLLVEA